MEKVIERQLNWIRQTSGVYRFDYQRGSESYRWVCREGYRDECLYAVEADAANEELSLDKYDAATITNKIYQVMPDSWGNWHEVEAAPVESAADAMVKPPDVRWLAWVLVVSGAALAWLVCSSIRVIK